MEDRIKPRNWGIGIPKYEEKDLMTKEEIHDFGVEIVAGQLQKEGYTIREYNPRYGSFPSIIAENSNEVVAVIVLTNIAPKIPKLKITDKFGIIGYCNGYPTKPCFASVGIGSSDPERFKKSLALAGDEYHARYTGLEYISKELPEPGTEEYKAFVMQFVGGYLRAKNYEAVKKYISSKCIVENSISKKDVNKPCIDYLKEIFNEQNIIEHCIIKSEGNVKTIKVQKLHVKGYSDGEPGTVQIFQEADKIGLLLVTEKSLFNNDDPGLVFNVDFDANGKINKLEIIDARLYGFKSYNEL